MRRFIVIIGCVLAMMGTPAGSRINAQDDVESKINAMAATVHRFNVGSGNYTEWIGGKLGKRPNNLPKYIKVGEELPDMTIKGLGGTKTIRISTLETPYLLNFWASWCPPCRDEFPLLTRAALGNDLPFKIYFVNTSDTQRTANSFLRTQRTGISVLFDGPPYPFNQQIGIQAIPDSILVGKDNTIIAVHVGEIRQSVLDFLKLVAAHPGVGAFEASGVLPPVKPFALGKAMPLVPGLPYHGRLDDGLPVISYRFNGIAGQETTFVMRADGDYNEDAIDPYLLIVNAKGEILAFDDDGGLVESAVMDRFGNDLAGSDVDALLRFTPEEDGEYYVIVARAGYEEGANIGTYWFLAIDESAFF